LMRKRGVGRPPNANSAAAIHRQMHGYGLFKGESAFKREVEFELLLPFKTKRVEKTNNNGEKKQAKLEIRKRMINERVKARQRLLSRKKIEAIKELIAKGELTPEALRWKVRSERSHSK